MQKQHWHGFVAGGALAGAVALGIGVGHGHGRGTADAQAVPPAGNAPAVAMSAFADGSILYADAQGRMAHVIVQAGKPVLTGMYAVRYDRDRFAREPEKRAAHGFYLDDLAAIAQRRLVDAQAAFTREANLRAVDAEANARLERLGREVLGAGDATLLLESLKDKAYGTRRAAAIVLGGAGYPEARAALEEVATEKTGDGAERARRLLEGLAR